MELQLDNINTSQAQIEKFKVRETKPDNSELKESIRTNGILQSILVNRTVGNKFEVVCGVRRVEIAKQLGLKKIPAIIGEHMTEADKCVYRLVENSHRINLTDDEKGNLFIRTYKAAGFDIKTARTYLSKLNNIAAGHIKHESIVIVPKAFKAITERMGYSISYQYNMVRLVTELSESVSALAEREGLAYHKKLHLIAEGITEEKDSDVREYAQKKMISQMKGANRDDSKRIKEQTIHNLKSKNVYVKDPETKSVVYQPYNIDKVEYEIPDDITEKVKGRAFHATVFKIENAMSELMEALTGVEEHNFNERVVNNTNSYRLELFKKIDSKDAARIYNNLFAVKAAVDQTMQLLDKEIDSKEVSKKIFTK